MRPASATTIPGPPFNSRNPTQNERHNMYGGPFYSAGFVRIVNDVKYRCRHVSFAHWVSLMNGGRSLNCIEVRKVTGRSSKLVAKVANEAELDAFLDKQIAS